MRRIGHHCAHHFDRRRDLGVWQILTRIAGPRFDEAVARNQITAELSRYFEKAFREFVEMFRTKLSYFAPDRDARRADKPSMPAPRK
jgi:hypothetical protein